MGKDKFEINLDNPKSVYYPGQTVSGKVDLKLDDDMKVRDFIDRAEPPWKTDKKIGYDVDVDLHCPKRLENPYVQEDVKKIRLKFYGYAQVRWTERRKTKNGHRTVTYSARENYFNYNTVLFGKEQTGKDSIELDDGKYSYPFSYKLPPNAPSSYEATIGRVRYYLEATIDRPWAFDRHTKAMITVINMLDLNTMPNLMNGASCTDSKTLCCLCCESPPITATVKLDRTGYVAGEAILFNAEINNMSDRDMSKSEAKLIMEVRYMARSKTRTVRNVLSSLRHGRIEGGASDVWVNEKLLIPPVPPSYLPGCNIIDIRYYAAMVVDPSGPAIDLYVPVEVVIGSIPLRQIAEQHGMVLPPPPPPPDPSLPPPAPGVPAGLYTDANLPQNMPDVTFAESAFGRVNTKEEEDTENTEGNSEFAPVYTYYNWEKQDPATNFNVQMNEGDEEV